MADSLGTLSVTLTANVSEFNAQLDKVGAALTALTAKAQAEVGLINTALKGISTTDTLTKLADIGAGFTAVGTIIKNLNGDVSSFAGQAKSSLSTISPTFATLGKDLQKLATPLNNLGKKMERVAGAASSMAIAMNELARASNKLSGTAAGQGGTGLSGLGNSLQGVSTHARKGGNSLSLMKDQLGGARERAHGLVAAITGLNIPLNEMIGRVVVINTVWKAWGATIRLIREGIQNVIDVDQALRNVQAVSLSFGKEFEEIQNTIRLSLQQSIFSGKELAETYVLLGQAGLTGKESTQAFNAIVQLATASMTTLADATQVMTTVLKTYHLSASQATDVTNQLVAATNRSKLSIEGLNTSFNFAGPAAANAGLALNETLGALAVMADNGIKASTQGTGLRQVLSALLDPSDKFTRKLTSLGIRLDQVSPLTNSFSDILQTLKDSGFGAADAFASLELRTAGAMTVLVRGAEVYSTMSDAIEQSNSALAAQLIQQQGLSAQFDILKNKFFDLFLGPDGVNPVLRGTVGLLTDVLDKVQSLVSLLRKNKGLLGGIIAAGGAYVGGKTIAHTGTTIAGLAASASVAAASGAAAAKPGLLASGFARVATATAAWVAGLTVAWTTIVTIGGLLIGLAVAWKAITYGLSLYNEEQKKALTLEEKQEKSAKELLDTREALAKAEKTVTQTRGDLDRVTANKEIDYETYVASLSAYNRALAARNKLEATTIDQAYELKTAFQEASAEIATENEGLLAQNSRIEGVTKAVEHSLEIYKEKNDTLSTAVELNAALQAAEQALGIGPSSLAAVREEANRQLEKNNKELDALIPRMQNQKIIAEENIETIQKMIKELEKDKDALSDNAAELLNLKSLEKTYADSLDYVNSQLEKVTTTRKVYNEALKKTQDETREILADQRNEEEGTFDIGGTHRAGEEAQAELDEYTKKLDEWRKDLKTAEQELEKAYKDFNDAGFESDSNKREAGRAAAERAQGRAGTEIRALNHAISDYEGRVDGLRKRIDSFSGAETDALNGINRTLEEKIELIRLGVEEQSAGNNHLIGELEKKAADLERRASRLDINDSEAQIKHLEEANALRQQAADLAVATSQAVVKGAEKEIEALKDQGRELGFFLKDNGDIENANGIGGDLRKAYEIKLRQARLKQREAEAKLATKIADIESAGLVANIKAIDREVDNRKKNVEQIDREAEAIKRKIKISNKAFELENSILEARKDLAVSTQQEAEINEAIYRNDVAKNEQNLKAQRELLRIGEEKLQAAKDLQGLNNKGEQLSVKASDLAKTQISDAEEMIRVFENKQVLLELELDKVSAINQAWRDVARTVNDGYSQFTADLIFGDKEAWTTYKDNIVDSFKEAFTESIKAKVTLLDKPFKGNIFELAQNVVSVLGGAFTDLFSDAGTDSGHIGFLSKLEEAFFGADQKGGHDDNPALRTAEATERVAEAIEGQASLQDVQPVTFVEPGGGGGSGSYGGGGVDLSSATGFPALDRLGKGLAISFENIEQDSRNFFQKIMDSISGLFDGIVSGFKKLFGGSDVATKDAVGEISATTSNGPDAPKGFWGSIKNFFGGGPSTEDGGSGNVGSGDTGKAVSAIGGAVVGTAGPILVNLLTDPKADAQGTEKKLNKISSILQTVAAAVAVIPVYGWAVSALLYVASVVVPLFAPDRFTKYIKKEASFIRRTLIAAGGEDLKIFIPDGKGGGKSGTSQEPGGREPLDALFLDGENAGKDAKKLALMIFNPFALLMKGLKKHGELKAANDYILSIAEGFGIDFNPGDVRARFAKETTTAFQDRLIRRGNDREAVEDFTDALSALELVKAAGIKRNRAWELSQTAVNLTLAEMVAAGYDLNELDFDIIYRNFAEEIGSFDNLVNIINDRYEAAKRGDIPGFNFDTLRGIVEAGATMFSEQFPKGINVARRAMNQLSIDGEISISKLTDEIQEMIQVVADAANKIAETPLKVLAETGSSTESLNSFADEVDAFIKENLAGNITSLLSTSVIEKGFLTPIFESVQDISSEFFNAEINATQFGSKLRSLFTENLLPNIGVFKNILKETMGALAETLGFPLDLFPALFGSDSRGLGYGLNVDTRATASKSFTQSFLRVNEVSDEVAYAKDTGNRISENRLKLGGDFINNATKQVVIDESYATIVAKIFDLSRRILGFALRTDDLDVTKMKGLIDQWIFGRKPFSKVNILGNEDIPAASNGDKITAILLSSTGEGTDLGRKLSDQGFEVEVQFQESGSGGVSSRTSTTRLGGTDQGEDFLSRALTNAGEERREALRGFLEDTGLTIEELDQATEDAHWEFPGMFRAGTKSFADLNPEQMELVLSMDRFSEAIRKRLKRLVKEIKAMGGDVAAAISDLASNITTADEFSAFYSTLQQALDEGFVKVMAREPDLEDRERFEKWLLSYKHLLATALQSLQDEVASSIDVTAIFDSALSADGFDAAKFRNVLNSELQAFDVFSKGVEDGILSALSSGAIQDGVLTFTNFVKKSLGDSVLSALVQSITNSIYIDQIFGPFLAGLGDRVKALTKGTITPQDLWAFINRDLPGVTDAITEAGVVLDPLLESIFALFSETGLIDAYASAQQKQSELLKQQLAIAEKWDDILKSVRDAKAAILYGEGSPQQIRQQIADARKDLDLQLRIFRRGGTEEQRQEAASEIVSIVSKLFRLGVTAGDAGLGDFQTTSAAFQDFSRGLIAILDEVQSAAIDGVSQLELLQRQVQLLEEIAENTRGPQADLDGGDPDAVGRQTDVEREILELIAKEQQQYEDQQDYRLSEEWRSLSQEERDRIEEGWAFDHEQFEQFYRDLITGYKNEDARQRKIEREYMASDEFQNLSAEQQQEYITNAATRHTNARLMWESIQTALNDAIAAGTEYRSDENPDEAPTVTPEEELIASNTHLATSIDSLKASIDQAYQQNEHARTNNNNNTESLIYTTDGSGESAGFQAAVDGSGESAGFQAAVEDVTASKIDALVRRVSEILESTQTSMFERLLQKTVDLVASSEQFVYNGSVEINIHGQVDESMARRISEDVETTVLQGVRRGRIGAEIRRRRR